MPAATHVVTGFNGGELSKYAEGQYDKPDYKKSMRTCLNSFPVEAGAWMPRPGFKLAGTTLNGAAGRVIEFDFKQASPVTCEYTDGNLRFRSGTTIVGGTLATPYVGGAWANIRVVQAETTQILLSGAIPPQALVAASATSFSINPAIFNDGPYLDPFTNGVQVTPSAKLGIIALQLSFQAYDASKAYPVGAFVSNGGVNYVSLLDQNVGNAPASGAPWWATTSVSAAINGGQGFLGSDVGRLVRLFSEPSAWAVATAYATGNVVSYNPSGQPGATTYWTAVAASTGVIPGQDLTKWSLLTIQGAALWSWGKITSLSTVIDRALAGSASLGNMTQSGGLAAAFDGVFSKASGSCATLSTTGGFTPGPITFSSYVGKNYSGATDQKIAQATVFPSTNEGFISGSYISALNGSIYDFFKPTVTINLRGKASAPASASDGTLLGTSGSIVNTTSAVTITSTDQTTAWKYVWVEILSSFTLTPDSASSYSVRHSVAQLSLFGPPGTGTSTGVNVEILGPALLYTNLITSWRLGVYSDTTGYPTCGVYFEGRIYLGGAVPNRFDASYANGNLDTSGKPSGTINFAPTDQFGSVTAAHAISYTLNSDSVNPILWMASDLQGVLMGTQAGEWLVQAPTAGPISPTNITARNVTHHGGEFIQPARCEHTLIVVKRAGRKLLEFFPDVISGKFSAQNLADKAQHIVAAGVAELAYTGAVTPILWGRDNDGALFGITYKRDSLASSQPPTFYGWHRHSIIGGVVESICSGASVGGDLDALTIVVNLSGTRYVMILTDTPEESTSLADAWYLDGGINPTVTAGTSSATLSGLPWADGVIVQVFAGGLDLGDRGDEAGVTSPVDFTVSGGAVTVPFGDGVSAGPGAGKFTAAFLAGLTSSQIIVGFTYNSDGEIVKPLMPPPAGMYQKGL